MTPEIAGVVRPAFEPSRKRRRTAVFATVTIVVTAVVIHHLTRAAAVTVTPVVRGAAVDAVYAAGTVEAVDRDTVKAKIPGAIVALNVKEGDRVKKGDVLAVVDARALEAELARVESEARAAVNDAA
jgi:multidrug efflux pump subunit AcrA (membrane-fusion protein)